MEHQPDLNAIANELDLVHATARQAFLERDLEGYRRLFTDDLRYVQPDGKAIGRDRLMRDVRKQLSQFKTVDSHFARESLAMNDDGTVTQVVRQNGKYSVSILFFFTKTWQIHRRGKYTFRKTGEGWRICDVEVFSEAVKSQSREKVNEQ